MGPTIRHVRLLGVGLVLLGVLAAGGGVYLDYSAPPRPDAVQPSGGSTVGAGGCGEPGLRWLFGGVAVTLVGVALAGSSHLWLWRR